MNTNTNTKTQMRIALGAALIAVMSILPSIPLPFSPVPITLQTFAVVLVAVVLGSRYGAAAVGLYLCLGATGLPVFAEMKGGVSVLLGPTGGYLIGFLPLAALLGFAADRTADAGDRLRGRIAKMATIAAAGALGLVVVYALGTLRLAQVTGLTTHQALAAGTLPFVPLDLIKLGLGIAIGVVVRERSGVRAAR